MSTTTVHDTSSSTTTVRATNTKAVVAFVTSFTVPLMALVFAVLAHREIGQTGEAGRGYATAAMVISVLWGGLVLLILAGLLAPLFNPYADYLQGS